EERQGEGPLVTEEPPCALDDTRAADGARRPAHGNRQSLAGPERSRRAERDEVVGALLVVVSPCDTPRPGVGESGYPVERDRGRRGDNRLDLPDRHVPFRARDVPVELLVIVHVDEGPAHPVRDDDGLRRIARSRHEDLDPDGAAETGYLGGERFHVVVRSMDVVHPQDELDAAPLVPKRNGPEDTLAGAVELEGDGLA